ncbi:hypothetical protein DQ239_02275 [Blastococcus sp. TF02-09]|uniref:hypothetical protein n=1 Tax=Blastococcus sp. TF02-09 TaxID=2250576 RepID=UPI000DE863A1|nr:hypothetical protein [Blastococcus sp. TF02-9]RBY81433.1 hypothetical protein DQ239_02275 [Blastococcus sp. TF02-9]
MTDPHGARVVLPGTRWLLRAFSVLTFLAFVSLFLMAARTDRYFAWTIAPAATAAFVGAAYAAGCLLVVLSLRERWWSRVRVPFVTVLVFTVVTLAATLLHLDRFHFAAPGVVARAAAWFWVAVYVVVPPGMLLMLVAQERLPQADPPGRMPLPRGLAAVLGVQGAVFLAVGAVLFVAPGTETALWPWSLTPLTARTVAAWLLAFGVGTVLALRDRDLDRLELAAVAYAVFGALEVVVLLLYSDVVRWNSAATYGYLALAASTVAGGGYALRLTRAAGRTHAKAAT